MTEPTRADLRLRTTRAEEHCETLQRLIVLSFETLERAIEAHGIALHEHPRLDVSDDDLMERCRRAEHAVEAMMAMCRRLFEWKRISRDEVAA